MLVNSHSGLTPRGRDFSEEAKAVENVDDAKAKVMKLFVRILKVASVVCVQMRIATVGKLCWGCFVSDTS